jgi:hypothetical protein
MFLEIKYLRGKNCSKELNRLGRDIEKLRYLKPTDLECSASLHGCGTPTKFLLVLSQGGAVRRVCDVKSKKNAGIIRMLELALRDDPPEGVHHSVVETHLRKKYHWKATAFGQSVWPKTKSRRMIQQAAAARA